MGAQSTHSFTAKVFKGYANETCSIVHYPSCCLISIKVWEKSYLSSKRWREARSAGEAT